MNRNKNGLQPKDRTNIKSSRRGFTLVEMLVSVALVVMMMVLFAQIFQSATGAMTTQKGIATNDQYSRFAMTILRNDIRMRTFREIVPFTPSRKTATFYSSFNEQRSGYWEIDENDPNDPTDDVLQFTVLSTIPKKLDASKTELPEFAGRATLLQPLNTPSPSYVLRNQPEYDDGKVQTNNAGLSKAAEVCYFLRGKTLYRRVLLIRQPYVSAGRFNEPSADILPPGEDYDVGHVASGSNGIGTFWHDFDYSAFYRSVGGASNLGPVFHVWDRAKDNSATGATLTNLTSLGIPHLRFGYSIARALPTDDGTPLDKVGAPSTFIGRYTLQETANVNFAYPGSTPSGGDPHDATVAAGFNVGANNEVVELSTSSNRRGEDILMRNVLEFDIKVWDDNPLIGSPKFVDLGNGNTKGYYGNAANTSAPYYRRYDTWHPDYPNAKEPPFRPVSNGRDGQPGRAFFDDDGINGIDDIGELGYPGTDDEISLKAIQITIRFIDPKTQITRQVTIVESLVDH